MDYVTDVNSLFLNNNMNFGSIDEIKLKFKEFCSNIKKFISNLANNNGNISKTLETYIMSIRIPLMDIANYLKKQGFEEESLDIYRIKDKIVYIMNNQELFTKYYYLIGELLDLLGDLILKLDNEDYGSYYSNFKVKLDEYFDFFTYNVFIFDKEKEKEVLTFTRLVMGAND